jgi:trehalose-phosphatase
VQWPSYPGAKSPRSTVSWRRCGCRSGAPTDRNDAAPMEGCKGWLPTGGLVERVAAALDDIAQHHDGLLVERKRLSVALHYRRRQDLESLCRTTARALAISHGLALLEGKMVVELKASARTKGDLIDDFMSESPFRGRQPVFFGDDVTDEDAFRVLPRWEGIGVKVGTGPTAARHRIANPAALHVWLLRMTADRNGTTRVELARR